MSEDEEVFCICTEWDGRGWSVCGIRCPAHPPDGQCPDCKAVDTHNNRECFACYAEAEANAKSKLMTALEKADHCLVQCFFSLERVAHLRQDAGRNGAKFEKFAAALRKQRDFILHELSEQRQYELDDGPALPVES